MNLREAQKNGKIDQFIKEHEKDNPADKTAFARTIKKMVPQTQKPARETSSEDSRDG